MEISFCDLRCKEVINIADGRRLGRIIDLLIDCGCGKVRGIIVPGEHIFSIFRKTDDLFIPWDKITKIGDDVILVKLCAGKHNEKGLEHDFAKALSVEEESVDEIKED